jgi:hypothetical protein
VIVTKVEVDKAGKKVRVYHHKQGRGAEGQGVREAWTHPYDEKATCEVCQKGR